ncbi:disintegrin and metalloproteinase domain-containing protein 21 [Heterocephalus glaber]|uniref:Disintegrin and metalloproteinase domain-containing protein 21 n=1 Tax=Heterocephalus glaber TaxID=10181 RepID=A0AAX6PIV5_HETGA|nr:disintegrin and metalloproteinase domain-containing protein 21 [Heterocephalus glaber]
MRWAETNVPLRAPLLLLGLWALLGPVQGLLGRPSWRYISAEVVVPRRHTHYGKGLRVPGWLSYSLHFGGQRHIIHLRRKTQFLARHLLLLTQNDQGALQMEYPYFPLDCNYLGYVEGVPHSVANIDTCYGGLEGIIKLDDLTYEIKPLKDSLAFEHIVSQIAVDANATEPRYRATEKEHSLFDGANITASPRIPSKVYLFHPFGISGHLQCTNVVFKRHGNVTVCVKYMMTLAGVVQAILENLSARYTVTVLSVYDKADPVPIMDFRVPDGPYAQFFTRVIYKKWPCSSTFVILIPGPYELDVAPPKYSICSDRNLVYLGVRDRHVFLVSVVGAQQIGRSFGLEYDSRYCQCQRRATCVMNKHPVLTDAFSNCSYVDLAHAFSQDSVLCLYDPNFTYFNMSYTKHICGDRKTEGEEQCDCGSFKRCYANPCCESSCRFTPGSVCDGQTCCRNCTYAPAGTLCRAMLNICDLPEYCPGNTVLCPENLYLQNGSPCTEEGYCYHGNCTDRTMHCREIFGRNARNGDDICYQINTKANRFGFCYRRYGALTFAACGINDIPCGRLQCGNVTHLPRVDEHVSFHQSKYEDSWCFGLDEHCGANAIDLGFVRAGTPCGPGKYCSHHRCSSSVQSINYDCKPQKCDFKGVCNNKRQCHCHIGWAPPRCLKRGAGGSESSGPPPRTVRKITQNPEPVHYLRILFARIYAFIAALLFGVATNVQTIRTATVREVRQPQPA